MVNTSVATKVDAKNLRLPSPPRALAAILQAISDPHVSAQELGRLAAADPAFTVQLLKLANSSKYRRASEVGTVERAAAMLGVRSLKNIALCAAVQGCVDPKDFPNFDLDRFWDDSLKHAAAAQLLAEQDPRPELPPEEAFTLGLLLDLPVLALIQTFLDHAAAWSERSMDLPEKRRLAEKELFDIRHDELALELAAAWHLPDHLAKAMRYHHEPHRAPDESRALAALACDAETLASVLICKDKKVSLQRAQKLLTEKMGLDKDRADFVIDELGRRVAESAQAFGFDIEEQPSLQDILLEANRNLAQMNLSHEELIQKLEEALKEKDRLTRELEERNRELEELSSTDPLTGLPNRRAFRARLNYELLRTARSGGSLLLLIGDIDNFKKVNDTWGHSFGDQVLKGTANAIRSALRESDTIARVGGEEFAIILPSTDLEGGFKAAEKVLEAMRSVPHRTERGEVQHFSLSLGLAELKGPWRRPFIADAAERRLYETADQALYEAKESGRNKVVSSKKEVRWR